jgi:DNA-binding GntR family transcriptional regulator
MTNRQNYRVPPTILHLENTGQPGVQPCLSMQISEVIRREIDEGDLKPGETVSITKLTKKYGISRRTASRGLRLLGEEGRLRCWPGYGYTVQRAKY